ncbi:hypothetical protein [Streptomyces tirandamycinicus]|uniref:Uncharacterized protein n=1 Tax=Streptomyces tirandamycinicus TaxID=2174846 RepID=A0A2S1T277_9ACTN|nr:hypothetical protein [Streptomyces tirandamycinicus]AWI32686.1 hypothetical protein DDW44_30690 [Streptomyces tirandamycinicus]
MISFLDGLPDESRLKSAPIGGWTIQTELLAQLIEEVSLLAADRRREEPRTVTRPYNTAPAVPRGNSAPAQQSAPMNGHRKMLAAAARRGMVRPSV